MNLQRRIAGLEARIATMPQPAAPADPFDLAGLIDLILDARKCKAKITVSMRPGAVESIGTTEPEAPPAGLTLEQQLIWLLKDRDG